MKMPSENTLIVVVGPTAIGKTALAIKIANAFKTEIISADSRQFFKEMNIGTAVPSSEELAAAKHYFIQHKSIFEDYNVGNFEVEAIEKLNEIFAKNKAAIMVGGSGLYVDAVVKGLDYFPEVSSEIREKLNADLENNGLEFLQNELKIADPIYFEKVDIENPHRIIRALEIYRGTGKPYSSYLNKEKAQRNFNIKFIGLKADREIIYNRINQRVDQMISEGLLEEAKNLFKHKELNALQTVGYRELFNHFEGEFTLEQAVEEIKKNTRRFAKRQLTWFRKNEEIDWFEYDSESNKIIEKLVAANS